MATLNHIKPEIDDLEMEQMPRFFNEHGEHPFLPHIHNFYQIVWFRKGIGKHFVDFNEYPVKDNTLFFVSPGQIHWFEEGAKFEGVIIHFRESFLSDEVLNENVFLKYNVFNAFDATPSLQVCNTCAQTLECIVAEIAEELMHHDDFAHEEYLKHLVKLFLIQVQRLGKRDNTEPLQMSNNVHQIFVKFRQLLENHYRNIHTAKEYAKYMNVSSKSLYNYVMEVAHITPLQLIDNRIILEAKRLLQHSCMKVKEIAYFLGYDDPSYFVKFFKKQTGLLPTEFRDRDTRDIIGKR